MALIISIETSTNVGSIAVHENDRLLLSHESFIEKSHSEHIALNMTNILKEVGMRPQDVDALAVSKGPGSYTGLRIGVSVAKGFCYAQNTPLIAVDTLESMAFDIKNLGIFKGLYCPMIDARRMEVYCAIYDNELQRKENTQAIIVEEGIFDKYLDQERMCFFGNGAEKCRSVLTHKNAFFVNDIYPKAKNVGYLAGLKFKNQEFENLAYFEPYYLKEFVAKKPSGKNLV